MAVLLCEARCIARSESIGCHALAGFRGTRASIRRKGDCCESACPEGLFATLKVERLAGMTSHSHRQAKDAPLESPLWFNQPSLVQRFENALDTPLSRPSAVRVAGHGSNTRPPA